MMAACLPLNAQVVTEASDLTMIEERLFPFIERLQQEYRFILFQSFAIFAKVTL